MGSDTSVFVSYRRDDSKHAAGRLGERLGERFQLFMDIDSIRPGTDFTAVVRDAVDRADVVLAVIGKDWLFASSESGARRLDEPHDWVSLEVGTALKDGTPVIPVLVDGARMPDRGELPASLTDLASRQAISLDHESFAADCTRLIETIEGLVGSQESPDVDLWADPDYPTARSALLQGQWAKAAEGLERVLRRHPRHPQVQDQLAEARRRQNLADLDRRARDAAAEGRWGVAVEALEAIEALQPSNDVAERLAEARRQQQVRSLQQDVRALAQLGDWAAVIAADSELTSLDPRSTDFEGLATRAREQLFEDGLEADYRRGLQQLDAGEWEAGETTFAALLARRPDYRDCLELLDVARRRGAAPEPEQPEQPEQPEDPVEIDTGPIAVLVAPAPELVPTTVEEPVEDTVDTPVEPVRLPPPPPPPPRHVEEPRPDAPPPGGRRRSPWLWVGAAGAAVVLVGAVIAGVTLAGNDGKDDDRTADGSAGPTPGPSSGPSSDVPVDSPPPATGSELVAVPALAADPAIGTIAMASRTTGVQIDHLADVEEYGAGDAARSAPEGGRLVAFHLADFGCDSEDCTGWAGADLQVVVDGEKRPLPDKSGSYVVAVPAGATAVDLVLKADKQPQSLSLLTGTPGPDNIAVLARGNRTGTVKPDTFKLSETYSRAVQFQNGAVASSTRRDVAVGSATLRYWLGDLKAASPSSALMALDLGYTRPVEPGVRKRFSDAEMRFEGDDGKEYDVTRLDDDITAADAIVTVPAELTGGTLYLGGDYVNFPGTSDEYTVTMPIQKVRIDFS